MRNIIYILLLLCSDVFSQVDEAQFSIDVNYYHGSILPHSEKIKHLITEHPEGVFIAAQRKTFGEKDWQERLNYPDIGLTLHYQNNHNPTLGDLYGLFAHYNFYFLKRNLQLRVGQGFAYNTNPYHKDKNYRNHAFGTHWMPSTFFMLNYQKEMLWEGFGLRAGTFLIHHSNGTIKTPNTSINTVGANFGLHYTFDHQNKINYKTKDKLDSTFYQPIKYSVTLRSGIHESNIIGSGQYPFYFIAFHADKQITQSSAFQLGLDLFLSMKTKKEIEMMAVSFPELGIGSNTDYKKVGVFVGYELFLNRLSFETQFGYYIHDEYKADQAVYQHIGLKYYFHPKIFAGMGLKTHFSKAEAFDLSVGVRL